MTAPVLSPTAGFVDALRRLAIRGLTALVAELTDALAVETERGHTLRTAADFADSERSGYIDRTGLETP